MSKEYKLVEAGNVQTLEMLINEKVNQGWMLDGELSVQQIMNCARYTQVMSREKSNFNECNSDSGRQLLHKKKKKRGSTLLLFNMLNCIRIIVTR